MASLERVVNKKFGAIKPKEKRSKYLKRIVGSIADLEEDEWDDLPKDLQKWYNKEAVPAEKAGEDIPDFIADEAEDADDDEPVKKGKSKSKSKDDDDEDVDEDEDEEPKSKSKSKKSKSRDDDDDDEDEDEDEKPSKKGKSKKSKAKDDDEDEDDEDASSDKDEEDEEDDDMPAKKKAKKSSDGNGKTKGRKSTIDKDAKIKVIAKKNPYKKGTNKYDQFALVKDGMTVQKFLDKGGSTSRLKAMVKYEGIKLV